MKINIKLLFLLGLFGMTAVPNSNYHGIDWRTDYRTLTKDQFAEIWTEIFLTAIQKHCDEKLDCAWEREHGRIESAYEFYGADDCSSDTRFFPDIPVEGFVCVGNGWSVEVGEEASWE